MKPNPDLKEAAKKAGREFVCDSRFRGVHAVSVGFKKTGGKKTRIPSLVFHVEKKFSTSDLLAEGIPMLPSHFDGFVTDVVQAPIPEAENGRLPVIPEEPHGLAMPEGVRTRERPARAGISCGHVDITAGTLGGWVHTVEQSNLWYFLTNAHVGANTNEGERDDRVLQPGPFDNGRNPQDEIGRLYQRVSIRMGTSSPGPGCPDVTPPPPPPDPDPDPDPPKKNKAASVYWKVGTAILNAGPRLFGCPYRASVLSEVKARLRLQGAFIQRWHTAQAAGPACVDQPWPNLLDACLVGPIPAEDVNPEIVGIGAVEGVRDPALGMSVQKHGRTTFLTRGIVTGVSGTAQVSYREHGTALFEDQVFIEGDGGDFSAGGDSGSWILDDDRFAVGLLFAGGGGVTIANRMSVAFSTMGVTL